MNLRQPGEKHEFTNKTELIDKQIELILKNFDYKRVHDTMVATNWKWACVNNNSEVPNITRIKATLRGLLYRLHEHKGISTGGFYLRRDEDNIIYVHFSVEEMSGYDFEEIVAEDD